MRCLGKITCEKRDCSLIRLANHKIDPLQYNKRYIKPCGTNRLLFLLLQHPRMQAACLVIAGFLPSSSLPAFRCFDQINYQYCLRFFKFSGRQENVLEEIGWQAIFPTHFPLLNRLAVGKQGQNTRFLTWWKCHVQSLFLFFPRFSRPILGHFCLSIHVVWLL